jgi:tetratricopeptide (TPR) repeat protein
MNGVAALDRASALCDLRRWDDAIGQLRALLAIDPHSEKGLRLMAQAHIGKEDYSEALRWSFAAISENPENEWAHRLAALALKGLGRNQEACSMAREAVRLAPLTWQSHWVLSRVLAGTGSGLHEARVAADRAAELAPHEAESHRAVGMVAAADGRTEAAIAAFTQALALEPDNAATHNELGRLTLKTSLTRRGSLFGSAGGLAQAADGFATAVRADPRAEVSRRNLDLVLDVAFARQAQVILLVAWIAMLVRRSSDSGAARVLPTLLLVFPAFFALRFGFMLSPALRDYLTRFLRRLPIAGAVAGDAMAITGLVIGATVPRATSIAFACAVAFGMLARQIMWQQTRRKSKVKSSQRPHRISTAALHVAREVLVLITLAMVVSASSSTDSNPAAGPVGLAAILGCLAAVVAIGRRKD